MDTTIPFSMLYENMQSILAKPELYAVKITHFSAGGLGACAYSHYVTVAELVRCWQHKEYQTECPRCGQVAYIIQWAGHVNGGGYWEINAYCPHCGMKHHYSKGSSPATHHEIHWTKMRDILQEERNAIKNVKFLDTNDLGDSLTEKMVFLLQRENILLRQENVALHQKINGTKDAHTKSLEYVRRTLLKAYLECKRDILEEWYADYCKKEEECARKIDDLKQQKQLLKQQLRTGEITNVFYQGQLTSLKKKIEALRVRYSCQENEHLSALLPGAFNQFGETKLISLDDVVDFMDGKMGMREGVCSVAD